MIAFPNTLAHVAICAISLLSRLVYPVEAFQLEFNMQRIEQVGGEHYFNSSAIRIRKFNRTLAVLNGTFVFYEDIDDSYEGSIRVAYSSLGNKQFNEYPMKLPRKNICQLIAEEYSNFQHIWLNYTNLPYLEEGATLCPFPKGEYWAKDFVGDASWVPPVIPTGLWRTTAEIWGPGGESVGKMLVFCTVRRNY